MTELITVKISDLKENKTFSELVPEMTTQEYDDLVNSIRNQGVRQPIHILSDKTVLDGRHRIRACKEIGINEIQALVHKLDEMKAIEFVVDTAVERRSLTKEQKIDIVLRSSELIKTLESKAKQGSRSDLTSGSMEPEVKRTNERIGEMTGTSKATVTRMRRVRRESPELYDDVIKGEKSIRRAYDELPSVQKNKPKQEPKPKPKLVIPEPEPTDPEELKLLVAVENLEFNMNQIIGYVDDHQEKLYEAICQMFEEKNDFMNQAKKSIEVIDNLMNAYLGGNKNE